MKKTANYLVYVFAIIGACAVAYMGWIKYQRAVAEEASHAVFSAPPSKGAPDFSTSNAPPPPQP